METMPQPYTGDFMMVNNDLTSCRDFNFSKLTNARAVYEVVRIIGNIPLFIEDHLLRMFNSMHLMGQNVELPSQNIALQMQTLAKKNNFENGNIKLICTFQEGTPVSKSPLFYIFFIQHFYPEPEKYLAGMCMQSLMMERPNPNAKVVNQALTQKAGLLQKSTGADEILLVNHDNLVTEGSKSNIFFVFGDELLTPANNLVLAGITREKVIQICKKSGLQCNETIIKLEDLHTFSGAFITGTSPKIMPVRSIDQHTFNTQHPLIMEIRKEYDEMITRYLKNYRLKQSLLDDYVLNFDKGSI
ncbi:MAG: aminotransferase class IV [Bacteroidales bacterium]|nr:aminotransferase class IV [Bacteroidales bacterium]